ncbi:MAG: MFS transporter [Alphaproteobacteria bacterium]|nr:MFS transporter [Alphaproteobacteria bacterium]
MKRLLFSLYGFAFFNKFLLLTPVYAIFMQENGLNDLQLSTMFIISAIGTIVAQAPITFLTYRFGQRWSMILGQFLKAFAILLWLVMPNYIGFVIGMFMWGAQAGFRSVAFEGLVYDSVHKYGSAKDYSKILGRKSTYESIGTVLSAFGSLLMFKGYDWVTWASVTAILLSVLCLLMVPYRAKLNKKSSNTKLSIRETLRTGFKVCKKTPCLISIMLLTLFVVNVPFLDDFLSPIALQIGIQTEYVGFLSFVLLGCATVGQRFAYKFKKIPDLFLCALIAVVGIGYLIFSVFYSISWLWALGVAYMLFYGIYTLLYAQFQHMIPSRHRSVVLSLYTTLTYIVYMAVCGIIGLGGSIGSWRYSIMIQGLLMIAVFIFALVRLYKKCPLVDDTI